MRTFEDVNEIGMRNVIVRNGLDLMKFDGISKEEALIQIVVALAEANKDLTDRVIDFEMKRTQPRLIRE